MTFLALLGFGITARELERNSLSIIWHTKYNNYRVIAGDQTGI